MEVLAATDAYMRVFEEEMHPDTLVNSPERGVVFLYWYYRRINEGYLNYSLEMQQRFHSFTRGWPSREAVVDWFAKNIHEWSRTKYGLTNGKIDWYTGGCFGENSRVTMADGGQTFIQNLKKGDLVWTPEWGEAKVLCVVEWMPLMECVGLGSLWITPWHPILVETEWVFPNFLLENGSVRELKKVYNLILDRGHVVDMEGVKACTLGHGFQDNTVIRHPFYGTVKVLESLESLDPEGYKSGWVRVSAVLKNESDEIISYL